MGTKTLVRMRRNHGLEHATIAVLLNRGVRPPLGGYATAGGFFVLGTMSSEEVQTAADEALERMKEGERGLAVSPYCGTNLVVTSLLAGLFCGLLLKRPDKRLQRLPLAAAGIIGAVFAARPLGDMVQRRYTTLADVESLQITVVKSLRLGSFYIHRVQTSFAAP